MTRTRKLSRNPKTTLSTLADLFLDDFLSDPHVRIVGRKEDVLRVKDKVMAVLDAKVSQQKKFLEHRVIFFFFVLRVIA